MAMIFPLADGEWVLGALVLLAIMVAIDRLRGKKPGFRLSNYDPDSKPKTIKPPPDNGPGSFKISGVDRATRMDTTWYCKADSPENAKAKAELEGIVVTRIDRETGSKK